MPIVGMDEPSLARGSFKAPPEKARASAEPDDAKLARQHARAFVFSAELFAAEHVVFDDGVQLGVTLQKRPRSIDVGNAALTEERLR